MQLAESLDLLLCLLGGRNAGAMYDRCKRRGLLPRAAREHSGDEPKARVARDAPRSGRQGRSAHIELRVKTDPVIVFAACLCASNEAEHRMCEPGAHVSGKCRAAVYVACDRLQSGESIFEGREGVLLSERIQPCVPTRRAMLHLLAPARKPAKP